MNTHIAFGHVDAGGAIIGIMDLSNMGVAELLAVNRATLHQLRTRGVIRTQNAPQGDWAEWLVAQAFDGTLEPNSAKSSDVLAGDGQRLQVKARVVDPDAAGSAVTSPFRSWDFDAAVIVCLADSDLSVVAAALIEMPVIRDAAKYRKHVNGSVVHPNRALLDLGADVTAELRAAAAGA